MGAIMLTSGFAIKGYNIVDYLGGCSGEYRMTEGNLDSATKIAMERLEAQAATLGANAVIGLDVNCSNFQEYVTFVIANGTAVRAERIKQDDQASPEILHTLPVTNYNPGLPFQIFKLRIKENGTIQILVAPVQNCRITALEVGVYFQTIFGGAIMFKKVPFIRIKSVGRIFCTEDCKLDFPYGVLGQFQSAVVHVQKYIRNELAFSSKEEDQEISLEPSRLQELRAQYGMDVVSAYIAGANAWTCLCGKENTYSTSQCVRCGRDKSLFGAQTAADNDQVWLEQMMCLRSAKEMWEYIVASREKGNPAIPESIAGVIRKSAELERLYGNQRDDCMKKIEEMLNR